MFFIDSVCRTVNKANYSPSSIIQEIRGAANPALTPGDRQPGAPT
jgi:hypothetical protein